VRLTGDQDILRRSYQLIAYVQGLEIGRSSLNIHGQASTFFGTAPLTANPDAVVLVSRCDRDGSTEELARRSTEQLQFEADAAARPAHVINPVDLNTILVPHNWLLLANDQIAVVDVAALSRQTALPHARVQAWFDHGQPLDAALPLIANERASGQIRLSLRTHADATTLNVTIINDGRELWRKNIHTMVVQKPLRLPAFGAVQTKLRYDAPIAVGHEKDGASRPSLNYDTAWDARLSDVVIALPNRTRFVFWRGASYIPFWAGDTNTGLTYQWAEGLHLQAPNAEGGLEMPEALNDKELRYSSVRIVESSSSRVHVRWVYQATDISYRTWGDQPMEDYYFYPDGFGTRVVTLTAIPEGKYELSEFISIIPQAAYPYEVLPTKVVELIYLDGEKKYLTLPLGKDSDEAHATLRSLKSGPAVYRVFQAENDPTPAIYFSPTNPPPRMGFGPLYDGEETVTPAYWGDHWPLSRDKLTRFFIHNGLFTGPSHNSFMGWTTRDDTGYIEGNPDPISISKLVTIDTQGNPKPMVERRWAWLIAKSRASNDELRTWGRSFSTPPAVRLTGGRLNTPSFAPERRAIRIVVEASSVQINVIPQTSMMNPVFELQDAPKTLSGISIDGKHLPPDAYAWDGSTLWTQAHISENGATIRLQFR
jgi:hypothetical protein